MCQKSFYKTLLLNINSQRSLNTWVIPVIQGKTKQIEKKEKVKKTELIKKKNCQYFNKKMMYLRNKIGFFHYFNETELKKQL